MLTEPLRLWLTELEYEATGEEPGPYLFHPSNDTTRCVTSSQWSQQVKAVLKKYTGKAAPPKLCVLDGLELQEPPSTMS